ncbi:MAG TPA: diguanylate cyclase [bacterium]|nr:diguanylate cyclase [bacterium]
MKENSPISSKPTRHDSDDLAYTRQLNELVEAALDADDLQSMVRAVADRIADMIEADACSIAFWDQERHVAVPADSYTAYSATHTSIRPQAGELTLTESIATIGHTLIIEDAQHSEYVSPRIAASFGTISVLGLPMTSNGRVLGAIILSFKHTHHFSKLEVARSERVARYASFALTKMILLDEEHRRTDELSAITHIGMVISSGRDLETVMRTIFEQCRSIINLDTFYLALYDEASDDLSFPVFFDNGVMISFPSHNLKQNPGISGHIIQTRTSLSIRDALEPEVQKKYDAVRSGGIPSRSYIGVPLLYGDRVLGVLSVQSKEPSAYTSHHVQLVEMIAAQSAIAIENARLYGELEQLSITDGLTGAYNFRHMMELGTMEFAKSVRLNHHLSLLFFDIDHFRDFNNRYGHSTGNMVLVAVADRVRTCIRGIDLFTRYGGEEFVIILPETPPDEAATIASRVRKAVESLQVFAPDHAEALSVTISVGVASMRTGIDGFQQLLDAANGAERLAKDNGRNRIEIWQLD